MIMRNLIVILLAAILIFGCVNAPTKAPSGGQTTPTGQTTQTEACTQSQTFSDLGPGILGGTSELAATVTCAAGKSIVVMVDGSTVATTVVPSNDTQTIKLEVPATTDGAHKVTVEIDGQTLLSKDWNVDPLGTQGIKGLETDAVSFREWRATAIDIATPITVSHVKAYVKTQQGTTQPDSKVVMEIRKDASGNPGDIVATAKNPISMVTQTDNWLNFDFTTALSPGRYWLVMRVEQSAGTTLISDLVQVHYVVVDKTAAGNDHTRQMVLDVDTNTGIATETQWTPLTYDKEYNVVVTSK